MLTEPVQAKAPEAESKQEGQKHSEEGREMFPSDWSMTWSPLPPPRAGQCGDVSANKWLLRDPCGTHLELAAWRSPAMLSGKASPLSPRLVVLNLGVMTPNRGSHTSYCAYQIFLHYDS